MICMPQTGLRKYHILNAVIVSVRIALANDGKLCHLSISKAKRSMADYPS